MTTNAEKSAAFAYQAAMSALTTSQAHGLLFTALVNALRDNNVLSPTKIELIFRGVAATIDEGNPSDKRSQEVQQHMRAAIDQMAKNVGIELQRAEKLRTH